MQASRRIAVAGATGRVGRHVVDILDAHGHDVVAMSRASGVDIVTGEGLANALGGVEIVIDAASGPSPDQQAATEFFAAAARNLHEAGARAGVRRMLVVSIIGIDRFTAGYGAAKVVHERSALAGPVPARILRAAQFHEFVAQVVDWSTQGDVSYLPAFRTQLVAARTVAEQLVEMAIASDAELAPAAAGAPFPEIAGPRAENLVDVARLLVAKRGVPVDVQLLTDSPDPDRDLYASGAMLPGPGATLAGPTFAEWLDAPSAGVGAADRERGLLGSLTSRLRSCAAAGPSTDEFCGPGRSVERQAVADSNRKGEHDLSQLR